MILLVRHGETAANAGGVLLGRSDPPLTDLGRRQATALGEELRSRLRRQGPLTRVVTSPLVRARETADLLGLDQPALVDARWSEIDYGSYEGQPLAEVPAEVWRAWRLDPRWRPPGGESLTDVGERVRSALSDLDAELARAGPVVVASHVSPIKAAVAWALGVGDSIAWHLHLGLASISEIEQTAAGPLLRSFNETGHLRGSPRP